MKRILIFCVVATVVLSCGKDNFKTEPQVEIKSLDPKEVNKGEVFTLRAIARDKEGDIQDSVLLIRKRFSAGILLGKPDTLRYSIKPFGSPVKTEIEVSAVFSYGEIRDGYIFQNLENSDREFAVGIIVTDNAGHRSNYAESDKIILKKL
jgi:hypothetical protein